MALSAVAPSLPVAIAESALDVHDSSMFEAGGNPGESLSCAYRSPAHQGHPGRVATRKLSPTGTGKPVALMLPARVRRTRGYAQAARDG